MTACDNAAAEVFFASLKRELVHRYRWLHRADGRQAIVRWPRGGPPARNRASAHHGRRGRVDALTAMWGAARLEEAPSAAPA